MLFFTIGTYLDFDTAAFLTVNLGTLNLYQEMSDKTQNEPGQLNYSIPRKCQKCSQQYSGFSDILNIYSGPNEHIDINRIP